MYGSYMPSPPLGSIYKPLLPYKYHHQIVTVVLKVKKGSQKQCSAVSDLESQAFDEFKGHKMGILQNV